ncbi:hypothetical protein VTJ49DRAFT_1241 [Mycothermus thermophilus]|uniref:Uncharacterized protein n=1 Tax=Humicola insolens TaxID=85995 RepID=A0ABR3VDB4_HUMIN
MLSGVPSLRDRLLPSKSCTAWQGPEQARGSLRFSTFPVHLFVVSRAPRPLLRLENHSEACASCPSSVPWQSILSSFFSSLVTLASSSTSTPHHRQSKKKPHPSPWPGTRQFRNDRGTHPAALLHSPILLLHRPVIVKGRARPPTARLELPNSDPGLLVSLFLLSFPPFPAIHRTLAARRRNHTLLHLNITHSRRSFSLVGLLPLRRAPIQARISPPIFVTFSPLQDVVHIQPLIGWSKLPPEARLPPLSPARLSSENGTTSPPDLQHPRRTLDTTSDAFTGDSIRRKHIQDGRQDGAVQTGGARRRRRRKDGPHHPALPATLC